MRAFVITVAGAIGGAMLAVAVVFTMAANGWMPINDRQMQTYLMLHPDLAPAMLGRAQQLDDLKKQAAQSAALKKAGEQALFDPSIAFVTGPADAKKTLVEFYDYDCPYCRASLPAVRKFYEAHKNDTRLTLIELPYPSLHGPSAVFAAQASLAARRQPARYMDFHFAMMGEEDSVTPEMVVANAAKAGMDIVKLKADMADPAITKALDKGIALSKRLGIDGTPTFIFNGKMHPGMVDDQAITEAMKT